MRITDRVELFLWENGARSCSIVGATCCFTRLVLDIRLQCVTGLEMLRHGKSRVESLRLIIRES